jgi:hypothetical protein
VILSEVSLVVKLRGRVVLQMQTDVSLRYEDVESRRGGSV